MELSTKLQRVDLRSTFISGASPLRKPNFRLLSTLRPISTPTFCSLKSSTHFKLSAVEVETSVAQTTREEIESLLSDNSSNASSSDYKRNSKQSGSGASSISSGVRLENITKGYKGVTVLKDVSWEVKKGEKVGLVGVNGAGKTTQMRIISGLEEPDSGNIIKAKQKMKIAFLSQEFEVSLSRTVREEFMRAFKEEMEVSERMEKVQKAIEGSVDDLELMGRLLDKFDFRLWT